MELMVYVDTITINARGGDVAATNYVLSIMNIVSYVLIVTIFGKPNSHTGGNKQSEEPNVHSILI